MAEALMSGILAKKMILPKNILISDVVKERLKTLQGKLGVLPCKSNLEVAEKSSILVLAVKPQNLKELLKEVSQALTEDKLLISIAAGVRTEKIEKLSGKSLRLVRAMPNMPALVQAGISVLFKGKKAKSDDLKKAQALLSAVGQVLEVGKEDLLDAVTALSGSGPAYFFYFIEALREAGLKMGLSQELVDPLVIGTAVGSLKLLGETGESVSKLREKVTSPGGTTEAALTLLKENKFLELVIRALQAAQARSKELSR